MIGLPFIIALAAVKDVQAAPTNGSNFINCSSNQLGIETFPHPTNCSKYYQCDNGTQVEMNCPLDQHYNKALKICDDPNYAYCTNTTPTTKPMPPLLHNSVINQTIQPQNSTVSDTNPTVVSTSAPSNLLKPEIIRPQTVNGSETNKSYTTQSSDFSTVNTSVSNYGSDKFFNGTVAPSFSDETNQSGSNYSGNNVTFVNSGVNNTSVSRTNGTNSKYLADASKESQATEKPIAAIAETGKTIRIKDKNNDEKAKTENVTNYLTSGSNVSQLTEKPVVQIAESIKGQPINDNITDEKAKIEVTTKYVINGFNATQTTNKTIAQIAESGKSKGIDNDNDQETATEDGSESNDEDDDDNREARSTGKL